MHSFINFFIIKIKREEFGCEHTGDVYKRCATTTTYYGHLGGTGLSLHIKEKSAVMKRMYVNQTDLTK